MRKSHDGGEEKGKNKKRRGKKQINTILTAPGTTAPTAPPGKVFDLSIPSMRKVYGGGKNILLRGVICCSGGLYAV